MRFFHYVLPLPFFAVCLGLDESNNFQPDEFVSVNGKLEVTLTVDLLESLNGTRLAPAYNGKPVGPTLRVKPGDEVSLTLRNDLPPSPDIDRELLSYILDPQNEMNDEANVTIIYNRLSEIGNLGPAAFGEWGFHYVNLHFHGYVECYCLCLMFYSRMRLSVWGCPHLWKILVSL